MVVGFFVFWMYNLDMDIVLISDWLVVMFSFATPLIVAPQIIRVIKLKEANAVSLLMLYGSVLLQTNVFLNAYLHDQPQIMFSLTLSILPLSILIMVTHYYRNKSHE